MKTLDSTRLRKNLEEIHGKRAIIYQDVFAIGCWLHATGHEIAGRKLVREVLDSVDLSGSKDYLASIDDSLEGHEWHLARNFAHAEINLLIEEALGFRRNRDYIGNGCRAGRLERNCRMEVFYTQAIAATSAYCDVRIDQGSVLVEYEEDGLVSYRGVADGHGHYSLTCPERGGRATLHRAPSSQILEGSWSGSRGRGMWRIHLVG